MRGPKDPLKFPWPEYVRWRRPWWAYINPWRYAWTMERCYALMAEALESEVKWEIAGRPAAAIVRACASPLPGDEGRGR